MAEFVAGVGVGAESRQLLILLHYGLVNRLVLGTPGNGDLLECQGLRQSCGRGTETGPEEI